MDLPFKVDLSNKVVVITGAGGVLCSEFAKALSLCGASIALLDKNKENIDKVLKEIRTISKNPVFAYEADVLDKENLLEVDAKILKDLGKCNILINGAGGNHPRGTTSCEYLKYEHLENKLDDLITFFDLDKQGIEFVFNLNFLGTLIPSQVFLKHMIAKKIEHNENTIINISSMNAFTPLTKIPAYSGAKAAVSNFTQWLAVHASQVGVRVNAIAPGFFITKQNHSLLIDKDGSFTERAKKILDNTPLGRFGVNSDLIGILLFLVNYKASAFVTGMVVPIDGGFSSYSGV